MPLEERIANANYYSPQVESHGYITNEELDSIFTPIQTNRSLTLSPLTTKSLKKSSRKYISSTKSTIKNYGKQKKHATIKSPIHLTMASSQTSKKVSHRKTKKESTTKRTKTPKKYINKTSNISIEPSPKSIQKTIY